MNNERRSTRRVRTGAVALAIAFYAAAVSVDPVRAALPTAQRAVLQRYVRALAAQKYDAAFAELSPDERKYFATPANFATVFGAERLKIQSFTIVASKSDRAGTVALVSEKIEFFDARRQSKGTATAKVAYGIVRTRNGYAIKDPYHPWRVLAPAALAAEQNGVHAVVRTLSFYTGRLEMVATFANTGDRPVTILPYGRTALRDQSGKAYAPIASRLPGLTDKTLYTGLVLPAGAQYTGLMTFLTPDRFSPASLNLTIAPALLDGGDKPFELSFAPYTLPK